MGLEPPSTNITRRWLCLAIGTQCPLDLYIHFLKILPSTTREYPLPSMLEVRASPHIWKLVMQMNNPKETLGQLALTSVPSQDPLLVTVPQACKLLACGKTTIFGLLSKGVLERRKIGNATRITLCSVHKLVNPQNYDNDN